MKPVVALCALAACWSTPAATPTPAGALPGLAWITPRQPWRMAQQLTALVVDGDSAIVGAGGGWVARVDLVTGVVGAEQHLGADFTVFDLAKLHDGRWIVVGNDGGTTRAVALDGKTLAPTAIHLGLMPDRHQIHAGVAVTADGGVVIAGKGLPLAIYDPASWRIRAVLAAEPGWNRPRIVGTTLAVELASTAYAFDLATGARKALGASSTVTATSARVALKVYDQRVWWAEIWEHDRHLVRLAEPVDAVTLSDDGKRLAVARGTRVAIYDEPFAETTSTIELGPSVAGGIVGMTLAGDRLVVSTLAILRVVHVKDRRASDPGAPPWGPPIAFGLGRDGTVLDAREGHAWWLANGKVTTELALGTFMPGAIRPDEVTRIVGHDRGTIAVRDRRGKEVGFWRPDKSPIGAWLGAGGDVAVATEPGRTAQLLRSVRDRLVDGLGFTGDGDVRDVDPDSGDALVASGGHVWVANVRTGRGWTHPLAVPGCSGTGGATLERDGDRAATFAGRDLALWDRHTGQLLGTTRLPATIDRVVIDREGVVVVAIPTLAFWRPGSPPRVLTVVDLYTATADGTRVAVAFEDGRVALLDRRAAGAGATPYEVTVPALPAKCPFVDPFDLPNEIVNE